MKVTFVNPNYRTCNTPVLERGQPPIDIVNCATILQKKGFQVEVVDASLLKMSAEEVASRAVNSDVVVITTTSVNNWQQPRWDIPDFYEVVDRLREYKSSPFIIAFGPHSLFNVEGLARVSDLVVIGQPEPFFERLTPVMRTEDYRRLDGIAFFMGGRLVRRQGPQRYDLRRLPQPNLKLIPYSAYKLVILEGPMMTVETNRGCPEDCSFCFRGMNDYAFSSKTSKQVVNELVYIRRKLGIGCVYFLDQSIDAAKGVFMAWMQEIVRLDLGIRWGCQIRLSSLKDEQTVRLMSEAGCEVVCIGIEGATQRAFMGFGKSKSEREVIQRISLLKKYHIKVLGYFLIGSIYDETEEDIDKTIAFSKEIGLDYAVFSIVVPYPTTKFYDKVKNEHPVFSSERIPLCYSKHFSYDRLRELRKKAYRSFYLAPHDIVRRLGMLRHPHAYFRRVRTLLNILRG